jgi:hypothetical protein
MYNIQVEDVILIKIKPSSKKFNKKKIEEFENRSGVSFPKEYIKYIEKYNGGLPEENLVISEGAPPFILTSFFGTGLVSIDDLLLVIQYSMGEYQKAVFLSLVMQEVISFV